MEINFWIVFTLSLTRSRPWDDDCVCDKRQTLRRFVAHFTPLILLCHSGRTSWEIRSRLYKQPNIVLIWFDAPQNKSSNTRLMQWGNKYLMQHYAGGKLRFCLTNRRLENEYWLWQSVKRLALVCKTDKNQDPGWLKGRGGGGGGF